MMLEGSDVLNPAADNSVLHPVVMLVTTADRVALEQAGCAHRPLSQLLMGSTTEVSFPAVANEMRADGLRQEASGLARMFVNEVLHPLEID